MAATRRIRIRRFWYLLLFLVTAAGVAFLVHKYQVRRRVDQNLAQARLMSETDMEESLRLYTQYLGARPKDAEALKEYVALCERAADGSKSKARNAIFLIDQYERLLLVAPDSNDQRWKLAKLYLSTGRLPNSRSHLEILRKNDAAKYESDWEFWALLADIDLLEGRNIPKVVENLRRCVTVKGRPAPPREFLRLAMILRQEVKSKEAVEEANATIDSLVERNEKDPAAREARGQYFLQIGEYGIAQKDLEFASKNVDKPDPSLIGSLADLARMEALGSDGPAKATALKKAEELLSTGIAKYPNNPRLRVQLSEILRMQHQDEKAKAELRAAVKMVNDQDPFVLKIVDRMLDYGDTDGARAQLKRAATEHAQTKIGDYFQARLWLLDGNWPAALPLAESCAVDLERLSEFSGRGWLTVSECHSLANNPDEQLKAADKAIKNDPSLADAYVKRAEALTRLGRFAQAADAYKTVLPANPSLKPRYCQILLEDLQSRPERERNWAILQEALGTEPDEKSTEVEASEVTLARVGLLIGQNRTRLADRMLETAIKKSPKNKDFRLSLFSVRLGTSLAEGLKVLSDAEKEMGDQVEFRLARLAMAMKAATKPDPKTIEAMAKDADKLPSADQQRLNLAVAEALSSLGQHAKAVELAKLACDATPYSVNARTMLFDYAQAAKDKAATDKVIVDLRRLEGTEGPNYIYAKLITELPGVKQTDRIRLLEMKQLAEISRKKRATWYRIYSLLGDLNDLSGTSDEALDNYRKAIELGERNDKVVVKTYNLLIGRANYDEANDLLLKAGRAAGVTQDVIQRVVALRTAASDPQKSLARMDDKSLDYRDHLLRAQLLILNNQAPQAELAYRKAVELSRGEAPEAWVGLIRFLVMAGQKELAKIAYTEAEKTLNISKAKFETQAVVPLTLGLCKEALGDPVLAEKFYLTAAQLAPDNPAVLKQLSGLYNRTGRRAEAEGMYRDMMAEKNTPAIRRLGRRMLAQNMVAKPDGYANVTAAIDLVNTNISEANQVEDVRMKAFCLAVDPMRREEAKQILLNSVEKYRMESEEYAMLARLYFDERQYTKAEEYLINAVRNPNPNEEHLAMLARVQMIQDKTPLAAQTVRQLKAFAPASWEAASEEARLLAKQGDLTAAAKRILDPNASRNPGEVTGRIVPFLEEIGCIDQAEAALKDELTRNPGPTAHIPLALFYIRQKQSDKAVEVARKYDSPQVPLGFTARLLSQAVYTRANTAADKVPSWVKTKAEIVQQVVELAQKNPMNVDILNARAEVADATGDTTTALVTYEACLKLKPESEIFLNNTAYLMALKQKEQSAKAMELIQRVITTRGPRPPYLDTRGLIHIASNSPKKAIEDFTQAIKFDPKPVYYFHLAIAHNRDDYALRSTSALNTANALGLKKEMLHVLEWPEYDAMMATLKKR